MSDYQTVLNEFDDRRDWWDKAGDWISKWTGDREFGAVRSSKWPQVRDAHIKQHPLCEVCGTKGTLLNGCEVHHIRPFHLDKTLELQPENLFTLCRVHHFWWGHLGKWASHNSDVAEDAMIWKNKIKARP